MYKRHTGQVSMLETPEVFGSLPLAPNNGWIKLSKPIPWREFDEKYAETSEARRDRERSNDPFHCGLHEPEKEAPASSGLLFFGKSSPYFSDLVYTSWRIPPFTSILDLCSGTNFYREATL